MTQMAYMKEYFIFSIYRPKQTWEEGRRTDLITINDEEHSKALNKHIKLNIRVIPEIKEQLIAIVKILFCKEGARRMILG